MSAHQPTCAVVNASLAPQSLAPVHATSQASTHVPPRSQTQFQSTKSSPLCPEDAPRFHTESVALDNNYAQSRLVQDTNVSIPSVIWSLVSSPLPISTAADQKVEDVSTRSGVPVNKDKIAPLSQTSTRLSVTRVNAKSNHAKMATAQPTTHQSAYQRVDFKPL